MSYVVGAERRSGPIACIGASLDVSVCQRVQRRLPPVIECRGVSGTQMGGAAGPECGSRDGGGRANTCIVGGGCAPSRGLTVARFA